MKIFKTIIITCLVIGFFLIGFIFFQNLDKNDSPSENNVYLKVSDALSEGKENVILFPEAFYMDNKDIMREVERAQKSSASSIYLKGTELRPFRLKILYEIPKNELDKKRNLLKSSIKEIAAGISNEFSDDYRRIKAAHDYIIENTSYDFSINENNLHLFSESHDAYGAIINGVAVCDGYAKALKLILDEFGINSMLVYGTADGVLHTWNIVEIEKEFYHIDPTWDDPEYNNGIESKIYTYFLVKDKDISSSHIWDKSNYPVCDSDKYNYYFYEGLVAYNKEDVFKIINNAIKNGNELVSFRMINFSHDEKFVKGALKDAVRLSGKEINQFSYVYNPQMDYVVVILGGV